MKVGAGIVILRLHGVASLKGKRKIVKTVISRLRNKFNVSVAEVGANDVYDRAEIGFSVTGNDKRLINSILDKMINGVDEMGLAEMIDSDMEIIDF